MAHEILTSKMRIPTRQRGLISRPRLNALLRAGTEAMLTVVSAPAGFGKTTLLADWAQETAGEGGRVAWLSLEPSDQEPAAFWGAVFAALDTVVPGIGPALPEIAPAARFPAEHVLAAVLDELAAHPKDIWLVLDDYHVAECREVADGMTFLLEHLPPRMHLVIGTRADPLLPLPRWRAHGELAEIRAAQLRFTPGEASAYLGDAAGLQLAPAQAAALEQRTEGWIAALQLAALSLRGHQNPAEFITRFAGDNGFILDYLVEEVLARQPQPVQDFLLQTSILDRLTGPLCDAVTGGGGGSGTLADLERANLFLVPLDDNRQWYRYHHLFADVLRARLLFERPETIPLLHGRASRWYEHGQLLPEAVGHALAAPDYGRAAHLMELAAAEIRRNRQDAVMFGWLNELPADVIRRSPVLGVFRGFMLMAAGELDGVEAHLAGAEHALADAPAGADSPWAGIEEMQRLPASIAIYRASLAQARGDAAGTTAQARQALSLAGPDDHFVRGAGEGFLGLAAWAEGDVSTARQALAKAGASLHLAGNVVDELSITVVLADVWLAAGRPGRARELMDRALRVAQGRGGYAARATAELHVGLAEIDCEAGDTAKAAGHLEAARALLEHAPMTESRYRWFVAMGLLARARGATAEAIDFFDQAGPLFRPGFFPEVRPIAAMKARALIQAGRLLEAADWAAGRGVATTAGVGYLGEYDQLTLVRLVIAQHGAATGPGRAGTGPGPGLSTAAQPMLDRLLERAEGSGRARSAVEIRMLQALSHEVQGRRTPALQALAGAFAAAPEPDGFARLFLDEGAPMLALLRDAAHREASHHAASVLAARFLDLAKPHAGAVDTPTPGSEVLSERERQVLRLLGGGLGGPQIAGELFISYNTLRTHTKHIFEKLGVNDRRAAVRAARERGLL